MGIWYGLLAISGVGIGVSVGVGVGLLACCCCDLALGCHSVSVYWSVF